jgi:catechol 2,3-dioxygenase-like lactoylglutathione lyase family enzyme
MTTSISARRVNHMNVVYEDFDAAVAHFKRAFDAEFLVDMAQEEWHACLMAFGDVIFEFFVPYQWLTNARYGPHHVGLEYEADMDEVRAAIAERGIRIVRDIGIAVHTDPRDCFGVAFEFYDGSFHERTWDDLGGATMKRQDFWEQHPLGLTGLVGWSLAVADLEAASAFMQGFMGARVVGEAEHKAIGARGISLSVADETLEILSPTGEGALASHLARFGDGIRATRFAARDLGAVRNWFAAKGIATVPGDGAGSLALAETDNLGLIFEFVAAEG